MNRFENQRGHAHRGSAGGRFPIGIRRFALTILTAGCLTGAARSADAQRRSAIVAGVVAVHDTLPSDSMRIAPGARNGRWVRWANGSLIGAGIGAAVGLVASPIVNAQNSDHSEDAMTYIALPAFGAFLGLITGGIIGLVRGS